MGKKKITRTKGSTHQWKFDNIIADLTDNELEFMSQKYNKDLLYYRTHNNLNNQKNQQEYLEMQQRKKMIDEEIQNRRLNKTDLNTEIRFYANEGTILDSDNNILETIAYNQDETEIISLPSGNQGKNKPVEWLPKEDKEEDIISKEFTMMADVELPWDQWIKKYKLNEPINN